MMTHPLRSRILQSVALLGALSLSVLMLYPLQAGASRAGEGKWYARILEDAGPEAGSLCAMEATPCFVLEAAVGQEGRLLLSTLPAGLQPQTTWLVGGLQLSEAPAAPDIGRRLPTHPGFENDDLSSILVGERRLQAPGGRRGDLPQPAPGADDEPLTITLARGPLHGGALLGAFLAPSQDGTDAADVMSLYVVGDEALVELTYLPPSAPMPFDPISAGLVRTVNTWQWDPPSPDPAGVTYLPDSGRLLVSDSEVEEMNIYEGTNLFLAGTSGVLQGTDDTTAFTREPTGVTVNPQNGHIFISDDDRTTLFELTGLPASGAVTATINTGAQGNGDPEGVAYDADDGVLFAIDGVDREVYRYDPGADGRFGNGDDSVTHFDVGLFGLNDPEGIAWDGETGHLFVLDSDEPLIVELSTAGELLREIDISAANANKAAGLVILPPDNPAMRTLYVVDRGEDNNSHPNENDGLLYELQIAAYVPPDPTPTNTATHTPTSTPSPGPTPTNTATSTPTSTPSPGPTPTNTATSTPTNTATSTPTNTATSTPTNTATSTPTNTATSTPTNTATSTPTNTATATPTNTATSTPTNTATATPTNTATSTPTHTATSTPRPTNTPAAGTPTPAPTSTPAATRRFYSYFPFIRFPPAGQTALSQPSQPESHAVRPPP